VVPLNRIKFPAADRLIRKYQKNKKADFAVKVTPFGADRHPRIGSMHNSRSVISIEGSWDGYLHTTQDERKDSYHRRGISWVPIPTEKFRLQCEYLDAKYMENRNLASKTMEMVTLSARSLRRRGARRSRDEEILKLKDELRKKQLEIERLEQSIGFQRGAIVDAITMGILPPVVEPPFPLKHAAKLPRGPDALSIHSPRSNTLAFEFIEGNWTSKNEEPKLTASQGLFRRVIRSGKLEIRLWHHYQDGSGKWTWKKLAERKSR